MASEDVALIAFSPHVWYCYLGIWILMILYSLVNVLTRQSGMRWTQLMDFFTESMSALTWQGSATANFMESEIVTLRRNAFDFPQEEL